MEETKTSGRTSDTQHAGIYSSEERLEPINEACLRDSTEKAVSPVPRTQEGHPIHVNNLTCSKNSQQMSSPHLMLNSSGRQGLHRSAVCSTSCISTSLSLQAARLGSSDRPSRKASSSLMCCVMSVASTAFTISLRACSEHHCAQSCRRHCIHYQPPLSAFKPAVNSTGLKAVASTACTISL